MSYGGGCTPPLDDLLRVVAREISQFQVSRFNAATEEPDFGPSFNFVVGGNILGRGLTIDDLLVTYYLREAKTPQMDTVWQHARMYGYRETLMPYARVFLPARLGALFRQIHESEEELRSYIGDPDAVRSVIIRTPERGRATRPNALDDGAIRIYGGGGVKQIVPYFIVTDAAVLRDSGLAIADVLRREGIAYDGGQDRDDRFQEVGLPVLTELVCLMPIRDDDDGRWDTEMVRRLLNETGERYGNRGVVYARRLDPGENVGRRRVRGFLSGPEVEMAERRGTFVLALGCVSDPGDPRIWYPTLVLPPDLPPYVFNME